MKKLIAGIAAGLAVVMSLGLTACGGVKEKNLTEEDYKAYFEGLRNMPSRKSDFSRYSDDNKGNSSSQYATIFFDSQNQKVRTVSSGSSWKGEECTSYYNNDEYYYIEASKAYYFSDEWGSVKHDVTERVSEAEGATLWDKLVNNYILGEDLLILDLLEFKAEGQTEGVKIDEIYSYLEWNNYYTDYNEHPFETQDGKTYEYGVRWNFSGRGTFDVDMGETKIKNAEVEMFFRENIETGKLLSKDYTDGEFSIYLGWTDEDGSECNMDLRIRTFNLWYALDYTRDEDTGKYSIMYDTITIPSTKE